MSNPSLIKETAKLCFVVGAIAVTYAVCMVGTLEVIGNRKEIASSISKGTKALGNGIKNTTASVKENLTNRWEIAKLKRQARKLKAETEATVRDAIETVPQPQKTPVEV